MDADIASVFDLSPAEKLQLVQDLWDDLAANPEDVPFYTWQEEELDRRRAHLETHPESALTWEEVKRRTRSRYNCWPGRLYGHDPLARRTLLGNAGNGCIGA